MLKFYKQYGIRESDSMQVSLLSGFFFFNHSIFRLYFFLQDLILCRVTNLKKGGGVIERLKRETMQKVSEEERVNKTEQGESVIDDMHVHVLVILLGCFDSMLYPVFAPDWKQHTGFFALPLRSRHSQHPLHVLYSGKFWKVHISI